MSELRTTIIARVNQIPMTLWDQRSALGMARTWIDNKKPIERAEKYHGPEVYRRRDDLAEDVVKILIKSGELSADEMIAVLREVREEMDAPFVDKRMLGFRAAREARGTLTTPAEKKKARTEAGQK